ncbi:MAG: hypothetical protein ACRCX2_04530 [Paraclostridium sp.]
MKLFKLTKSTESPNKGRHIYLPNIKDPVNLRRFTFKIKTTSKEIVLYTGHDSAFNKLRPKYLNYESN